MKNFILFLTLLFFTGLAVLAQSDTVLNLPNVSTQVSNVIAAQSGHDLTWKILFFAAIAGVLIRIIITTIKGVKSQTNNSPLQFAFSYWVKDNILPKVATILTFIISSNFLIKLPTGIVSYIIFGVIGLILGYFLDWIYSILKGLIPK
jgi:hypothetical protein